MNTAQFRVVHAGPFVTFQDGGRPGNMRFGVSASGPMDRQSFTTANLAVGNQKTATAIEVSMGGADSRMRERCRGLRCDWWQV